MQLISKYLCIGVGKLAIFSEKTLALVVMAVDLLNHLLAPNLILPLVLSRVWKDHLQL